MIALAWFVCVYCYKGAAVIRVRPASHLRKGAV